MTGRAHETALRLNDLPLTEVPSPGGRSSSLAVLLSGDGGWNITESALARRLARDGMPVVGLNCLRYFWTRRTPDSAARDLERILDHYLRAWGERDVVLIGYSRGACVAPFLANRLRGDLRDRLRELVLLGADHTIDFQFHLTDWISNRVRSTSLPVRPEIEKLRGLKILCVYGRDEKSSLCHDLPEGLATCVERPGGHLIWRDVEDIAAMILDGAA